MPISASTPSLVPPDALVGLVVGLATALVSGPVAARARAFLRSGTHRYADEWAAPPPRLAWFVPVVMGGSGVLAAHLVRGGHPWPVIALTVAFGWVLAVLAAIDLDVHRLPDVVTLPLYPALMAALAGLALVTSAAVPTTSPGTSTGMSAAGGWGAWQRAALISLVAFALFGALRRVARGGFGRGDVKLAPSLAAMLGWYGWEPPIVALLTAFVLGGIWSLVLIATGRGNARTTIAFGPFLALGWLVGVLSAGP